MALEGYIGDNGLFGGSSISIATNFQKFVQELSGTSKKTLKLSFDLF